MTNTNPNPFPYDTGTVPCAAYAAPMPASSRPHRRGAATLAAVALAAGLVGGGAGAGATYLANDGVATASGDLGTSLGAGLGGAFSAHSAADLDAPAGSVEEVAATVLPSIVSIGVRTAAGGGSGTGVILSADGQILTNNHVIAAAADGAGEITVTFEDGRTVPATIVGRDPLTDLAVVVAEGVSGLTPAVLGDSDQLDPGEAVVAIGSPLGLQGTVTSGIVSALDRPVRTGGPGRDGQDRSTVIDAIQTDAAINPGNSGGALVNLRGEVVGINTAIASLGGAPGAPAGSIGLGFAIPVDQARMIAEQLVETGTAVHAQLGVGVADLAPDAGERGAGIASVQEGGAADSAGLSRGDLVTRVEDRAVDSADALVAAVRSYPPGDTVTLTVVRDGAERTVEVTLDSDVPTT
jgi:putative serine protease PepD